MLACRFAQGGEDIIISTDLRQKFIYGDVMQNKDYFDSIAEDWDTIAVHNIEKVKYIINLAGIEKNDIVLDIGSGTGVLIPYIKDYLGENGKIVAVDISEKMIHIARNKNGDDRAEYICQDFYKYSIYGQANVIIAYSCFPHFEDHDDFFKIANLVLKEKGRLVIAHSESREMINNMHNQNESMINSEELQDSNAILEVAKAHGFEKETVIDNDEYYVIILRKRRS